MIKILGNDGWYYFNINKIDGFHFDLNNLYVEVYLKGKTVSFYVKEQKDILDFINIITKNINEEGEEEWFLELKLEIPLE